MSVPYIVIMSIMCLFGLLKPGIGVSSSRVNCVLNLRLTNLVVALLFLLSVMSSLSSAAPSPYMIPMNPPNFPEAKSSITCNPCGVNENLPSVVGRHGSHDSVKMVKKYLNMTLSHFRNLNKTLISVVYSSTINFSREFIDYDLPKKQYQEYVKFRQNHTKLGSEKLVQHILSKLYEKLFFYGWAFEKLSMVVLQTQSSTHDIQHRHDIINKIKNSFKGLMCEVETRRNDTSNIVMSNCLREDLTFIGKDWPKNPDLTSILTIDMSIFYRYRTFLEDWINITKEVDALAKKNKKKRTLKNRQKKSKLNNKRNTKPRPAIRHGRRTTVAP